MTGSPIVQIGDKVVENGAGWIHLGEFPTYQLNLPSNSVERAELDHVIVFSQRQVKCRDHRWRASDLRCGHQDAKPAQHPILQEQSPANSNPPTS